MNHLSEEQLVLMYYGENEGAETARQHLESCAECRADYSRLEQTLATVTASPVPERGPDYGARVWRNIAPRLERQPVWSRLLDWVAPKQLWTQAAVAAMLVIAAFLAGRYWPRPETPPLQTVLPAPARERILLVAVGNHLERSQMILVELAHAEPNGGADISGEQEQARNLIADNRLYRQAAVRAGEAGTAQVLDELERVLVEVANSPSNISARDLEGIQQRIQSQGIIFKVRVLAMQTRRKAAPRTQTTVPKGKS